MILNIPQTGYGRVDSVGRYSVSRIILAGVELNHSDFDWTEEVPVESFDTTAFMGYTGAFGGIGRFKGKITGQVPTASRNTILTAFEGNVPAGGVETTLMAKCGAFEYNGIVILSNIDIGVDIEDLVTISLDWQSVGQPTRRNLYAMTGVAP